jgi:hypothetical protein
MKPLKWEALDWNPQWKWKTGRPKQTWRRSVHNEAHKKGRAGVYLRNWPEIRSNGDVLLAPYVPKGDNRR